MFFPQIGVPSLWRSRREHMQPFSTNMPRFSLLLLGCLLCVSLSAQQFLLITHTKRDRELAYRPGDWIRLEARAGEEHYHGYIEQVNDSMLIITFEAEVSTDLEEGVRSMRAFIPLDAISLVYDPQVSRWHRFKHAYTSAAIAGGGMIITGNIFNTLVNEVRPQLSQLISSTTILLSSTLVRAIGRDKYPIGRKWQVQAVPAGGNLGSETAMQP